MSLRAISRTATALALCAALMASRATDAAEESAQTYPSRTTKIVVPYPAGSMPDSLARFVAEKLQAGFGQPFVIDNRPGGSTLLGAKVAANAAADGYTLFLPTVTTLSIAPQISSKSGVDPLRDFTPIARLGATNFFLIVRAAFPATTLAEWIAEVRRNPGKFSYASAGIGTPHHIFMELLKRELGLDIVHVPYKSGSEAVPDLLAGRVDMSFLDGLVAYPHITGGQLRALGTSMGKGSDLIQSVPPIAATLSGFDWSGWIALAGPREMPATLVERIAARVASIKETPQYADILRSSIMEPLPPLSPAETAAFVRAEFQRWGPIIKLSGAVAE